jgi:phage-related protein
MAQRTSPGGQAKDLKTAQLGWPLGMPLIRKIEKDLWEVRTRLESGIARVFFTVDGEYMILLHGFIKKSQKTPQHELKTVLTHGVSWVFFKWSLNLS